MERVKDINKEESIVIAKIRYTDSEVELLINRLIMTCTTQIPTEDNGEWKRPYEKLLKDLKNIKGQTLDYKEKRYNVEKKENTGTQNPAECETCD